MSKRALQLIAENKAKHERGEDARYIDLGNCGLAELPAAIEELTWLETLILSNEWFEYGLDKKQDGGRKSQNIGEKNRIQSIAGVEKLKLLKKLVVAKENDREKNWELSDLSPLSGLTSLQQLWCNYTQVSDLFPLYGLIRKNVPVKWQSFMDYKFENISKWQERSAILAEDCPLSNPPREIVEQGNEAILSYFKSLEEAKKDQIELVPINEIKILLVGEGMAGKTSLLKKIKGLPFNKNESQTHGVIIEKLAFDHLPLFNQYEALRGVTGRFWDFGGQEIMHASHQFFLSSRSVYILLLDSRTDAKKEEWLKHIEKFGGDSPAIVAINKIDENKSYDVERLTLNHKFPFIGARFHRLSCQTDEGMEAFAKDLAGLIPETEIFKTAFNPSWVAVKDQLESETAANKYIDENRYEAICIAHGVTDKTAQKTLLKYLDSLGIALHFEKLDLQNFYVLDPHWVTIGVYKIINSQAIEKGLFRENLLDYILNTEAIKKETTPQKIKK